MVKRLILFLSITLPLLAQVSRPPAPSRPTVRRGPGAFSANDCAKFDLYGDIISSGVPCGAGSGETNTASNDGTGGVGVFDGKTGANLRFRNLIGTARLAVVLNAGNRNVELDVTEAALDLANMGGLLPLSKFAQSGATTNQFAMWNGTAWTPTTPTFSMMGQSGATTSQIPLWNGSAWVPTTLALAHLPVCANGEIYKSNGTVMGCAVDGGSSPVSSVFGRTGAVTALEADYSAFFASLSGSYNNPGWITGLDGSKINAGTVAAARLPNLSGLTGLLGIAQINATGTPNSTTYLRGDGVWGTPPGGVVAKCPPSIVSNTLVIPAGCVALVKGTPVTLASDLVVSSVTGSGNVWVEVTASNQWHARTSATGATCNASCTVVTGATGFLEDSVPIASVPVTSGTLGASPASYEHTPIAPGAGTGTAISSLGGQTGPTQTITRGEGIGGSSASDAHSFIWLPGSIVGSFTIFDSSQASRTITIGLSGATDPVFTFSNNLVGLNVPMQINSSNVATDSNTKSLTNTTLDTEGTGNAVQVPERREWLVAQCDGATGKLGPGWSSSATLAPTPTCTAGSTNTDLNTPTLRFPDLDGAYHVQRTWYVPNDWTANIGVDVRVFWSPVTSTSGNVVFTFRTICRGVTEGRDAAFASTLGLPASPSTGTAGQLVMASTAGQGISSWGASKVCTVDFSRDRTNASDTFTGELDVHLIEWTFRRIL